MTEKIFITNSLRKLKISENKIHNLVNAVAKHEDVSLEYVEISVVGKKAMASYNWQILKHTGPTDVISFDLSTQPDTLCAQIIVCGDVAASQSKKSGNTTETELMLYITHGLLHAIGYDDHEENDYRRMHDRENLILEKCGFGKNVFG